MNLYRSISNVHTQISPRHLLLQQIVAIGFTKRSIARLKYPMTIIYLLKSFSHKLTLYLLAAKSLLERLAVNQ